MIHCHSYLGIKEWDKHYKFSINLWKWKDFSVFSSSWETRESIELYHLTPLEFPPLYFTCIRMARPSNKAAHAVPPHTLTRLAREWLAEDTPNFDLAGVSVGSQEVEAWLLCKTPRSVLAGSPFFTAVFAEVGCRVDWIHQEGAEIGTNQHIVFQSTNILD